MPCSVRFPDRPHPYHPTLIVSLYPQVDKEYDNPGFDNPKRGARSALHGGIDLRNPQYSALLLQPLLEIATMLQDRDRWEDSAPVIERGLLIATAHYDKSFVLYFRQAKQTLEGVTASRIK